MLRMRFYLTRSQLNSGVDMTSAVKRHDETRARSGVGAHGSCSNHRKTISSPDLEIRTSSVPTAGHLLALGFEPLGVITHPSGTKAFRFAPEAREALERFL